MSAVTPASGPDIAPVLPGAPVVKKTERPHPLTPFIRGWLVLVALVIGFGRQLIPEGDDEQFGLSDLRWALPAIAGIVVIAAAIGFVTWYFTRFVIDEEELRVETGALFKTSTKIPFERLQSVDIIQPMAARIFGLVELRLEAGAGDSTVKLRYLQRTKADQLRDYLLTRAHGQHASMGPLDAGSSASALTDLSRNDYPLVKVSPGRLVASFVLSTEWLISVTVMIVIIIVTVAMDVAPFALTAVIPLFIGGFSLIGRRVISMFNFTLAESPRGLRVTRGLTNLTSQSVPVDRIQGVKTTQPLLWKPLGWFRVDVDIVGYGNSNSEDNDSNATSVLLPVATAAEVGLALDRVLPGFDLNGIERRPSPRRARWVRWFDFWTLRYGWNDRALLTEHGWLNHVVDIIPHAKTQSVRIEQGPLQRKLRLADVHFDTPKGPVRPIAQELDADAARELALSQLDRARDARGADRARAADRTRAAERARTRVSPSGPVDPSGLAEPVSRDGDPGAAEVLAAYGVGRDQLIGSGGESEVYALDEERVLRLYRGRPEAAAGPAAQLRGLYDSWSATDIGIEVPRILDSGERAGQVFTVDRRFSGRTFSGWLRDADSEPRRAALLSYLDAIARLPQLPSPLPGFARLVGLGAPQQFRSLAELLHAMLAGPTQRSRDRLSADLPEVAAVWERLHAEIAHREVAPALVHGDVCPPNMYVSLDPSGHPVVTGIGDFSPHTMNADPLIDLTGAVAFLELEQYPEAAADAAWLTTVAVARWGPQVSHWIAVYRRFYGFYFSDAYETEPWLYDWCLRQLRS